MSPSRRSAAFDARPRHIALCIKSLAGGGAERVFLTLARAFSERGHRVDLLLCRARGPLLSEVPDSVRLIELGTPHTLEALPWLVRLPVSTWRVIPSVLVRNRPKAIGSLPALIRYLRAERPDALLSTIDSVNLVALWGKHLARTDTRVVIREATTLSALAASSGRSFEGSMPDLATRWYPRADGIITVSSGVADDLELTTGISRSTMTTIYNPVDVKRISSLAEAPLDDPWFRPGLPPVLVSVGRLSPEKDHPTLLRALALARRQREVRLVLLGTGPLRAELESLARDLAVDDAVRILGFVENPYAYISQARAMVLSSAWEGFPNVLLEALACGCPIISTDCPSGPSEILEGGTYGLLVPIGDPSALSRALLRATAAPRTIDRLQRRAAMFSPGPIADRYMQVLVNGATSAPHRGSPEDLPGW